MAFALITSSQAVLLDGAFDLVSAAMGIVGLKIAMSLKTGIDPTDTRNRLEGSVSYDELNNGIIRHQIDLRFDYEFSIKEMDLG